MILENKLRDFLETISINQEELDEWYLSDFIDKNIKPLNSYESFEAMKKMVPYLIKYPEYGYELLEIIQELNRISDTTEIFYSEDTPSVLIEVYKNDEFLMKIIKNIFK